MDIEALIRSLVLMIGWPVLIIGSIVFVTKSVKFYKEMHELALGKLVLGMTFGQIISMYSLGFVATVFMYTNLDFGIKIVLPIFAIWFAVMAALFFVSNKWRDEAAKINILYYKITERTKELEREQKKLTHITDNMPTGAILLDGNGKAMFINREAKNLLNFKSHDDNEIIGALLEKFSHYKLREHLDECIKGNPSNILNAEVDGKVYEIFLRNLTDSGGAGTAPSIFGHFIWIRDITDEKNLEKSKNNFITIASHKMRTPLTGMKMFIEMLLKEQVGPLNEDQKKYLTEIENSTVIMVELTNKLLKLTTDEAINIKKINSSQNNVNNIIQTAINEARLLVGKQNEVSFMPIQGNCEIIVDSDLLKSVIMCLTENALIYTTNNKTIEISATINSQTKECLINIKDQGIGIAKNEQSLIFKKFFRTENAMKIDTEGTGTCLNNAKTVIESMGGKIRFESEEGIGTTFFIALPTEEKK